MIITVLIILILAIIIFVSIPRGCQRESFESKINRVYKNYKPTIDEIEQYKRVETENTKYNTSYVKEMYQYDNNRHIKNLISHVLYINLPTRTDRNNQTVKQLDMLGLPYQRISGVVTDFGGLGCSMAHLNALRYARDNNYPNVLICEDDIEFKYDRNTLYKYLTEALRYLDNNYDVLMLSGGSVKSKSIPNVKYVRQLESAQMRTAYLVNQTYYDRLIKNFEDNVDELARRGPTSYTGTINDQPYGKGFAGDQYWKRIQPVDRWFIMKPSLCRQRKSYSNIQNKVTKYTDS
jgi:GR25 family glycosyltransferase involved in LPS biosynthesis